MSERVEHDTEKKRFYVEQEGETAYMKYQEAGPGRVDFAHTWTPHALRGQGIAGEIVKTALDWAQGEDLKVIPTCSYVDTYIRRHEEYQELVDAGR